MDLIWTKREHRSSTLHDCFLKKVVFPILEPVDCPIFEFVYCPLLLGTLISHLVAMLRGVCTWRHIACSVPFQMTWWLIGWNRASHPRSFSCYQTIEQVIHSSSLIYLRGESSGFQNDDRSEFTEYLVGVWEKLICKKYSPPFLVGKKVFAPFF